MTRNDQPDRLAHPRIFINLVVADVAAAAEFYRALGWLEIAEFRDERSASLQVAAGVVVVLLAPERFDDFNNRATSGAQDPRGVINCVQVVEREDVEEMVGRAREAGGAITREPTDEGAVFSAAFDDLDGHGWELMWLNPETLDADD